MGQKRANAWDLYDMSGNAYEWCQDSYDSDYYANSPTDNPAGPTSGSHRVVRSGSWVRNTRCCRSALRSPSPFPRRHDRGFRLALVLPDINPGRQLPVNR